MLPTISQDILNEHKILSIVGFPGGSALKNPLANAEHVGLIPASGRSPGEGNGNPLQYSCWRIPWTEEPGGLQSMGSAHGVARVGHDQVTEQKLT